jgi:hypothetical protein
MFASINTMPPRKLQATPNVGRSQRKTLRRHFSIPNEGVGSRPSEAQFLEFRALYNTEVEQLQGFERYKKTKQYRDYLYNKRQAKKDTVRERKQRGVEKRNQREQQNRRRQLVSPIAEWANVVENLVGQNRDSPFTLRIESALVNGVVRDIRFDNYYQFLNWYNLIMDETIESNSDTVLTFRNWTIADRSIFDNSILSVNFIQGGCNLCQSTGVRILYKTVVGEFNSFNVYNPPVKNNNCGIACVAKILGIELSAVMVRREFGLEPNTEIPESVIKQIYNKHNRTSKFPAIISRTFSGNLNFELCDYILHEVLPNGKGHFLVVESINQAENKKRQKYRRSLLAFDFETRNIDKLTHSVKCGKCVKYNMVDTICSLEYRTLKRENAPVETKTHTFTTDGSATSARQFLDFLEMEHRGGRHYTCIAHNGSRFDFLLLVGAMTDVEKFHSEFQYRGLSIISMSYYGHIFRDPCCFMPNSLENLCNNFKVEVHKLTDFELNGETITNKNLCFYKPDLNVKEFLELQTNEPDYWALYVKYCEYDCKSLLCLWEKFLIETQGLIQKIGSYTTKDGVFNDGKWILAKCSVISKTTIGGLAKKIIDTLNKKNRNYENYLQFLQEDEIPEAVEYQKRLIEEHKEELDRADLVEQMRIHQRIGRQVDKQFDTYKKYNFVCNFKRGGISHCNQAGKHNESVSSVDITSQYPTAMMKMVIPAGRSRWVYEYNSKWYGYYRIKNLVFAEGTPAFKPICPQPEKGETLNWTAEWKPETVCYCDSEMIKYEMEYGGLLSFEVIDGLVSDKYVNGKQLFGKYVETLFKAKAEQDELKKKKDPLYNQALREVIKLFLNSLSGKLVEDPSRYYKLGFTSKPEDAKNHIDGIGYNEIRDEIKLNYWVSAGVMVYSYSKRLLFEYIRYLPEKANSVIHIETDGIYFPTSGWEHFENTIKDYDGEYQCVIGDCLGSVKQEHTSTGASYWLGKKFYYMYDEGDVIRIKGIPAKTIDKYGNEVKLVDRQFYEDVYNWKPVLATNEKGQEYVSNPITKTFSTLVKSVFGTTGISSMEMVRTITPQMDYHEYN